MSAGLPPRTYHSDATDGQDRLSFVRPGAPNFSLAAGGVAAGARTGGRGPRPVVEPRLARSGQELRSGRQAQSPPPVDADAAARHPRSLCRGGDWRCDCTIERSIFIPTVVTTESTSAMLRRIPFFRSRMVLMKHGAGDREGSYNPKHQGFRPEPGRWRKAQKEAHRTRAWHRRQYRRRRLCQVRAGPPAPSHFRRFKARRLLQSPLRCGGFVLVQARPIDSRRDGGD